MEAAAAVVEGCASASTLALDPLDAILVLHALEHASPEQVSSIGSSIRGLVCQLARTAHGSELLEHLLHRLGTKEAAFIAEELLLEAQALSLNHHASAVICRVLEYMGSARSTEAVVDAVCRADAAALVCHKHGHRVAMSILSNGAPHHVGSILAVLLSDVQRLSRHRFASQVVEQALKIGPSAEVKLLGSRLTAKPSTLAALTCHHAGVHVVRALLQGPCAEQARDFLRKCNSRVAKDRYGSVLLRELGLLAATAALPSDPPQDKAQSGRVTSFPHATPVLVTHAMMVGGA